MVSSTAGRLEDSMADEMADSKVAMMAALKVYLKAIRLDDLSAEPTVGSTAVSKDAYSAYHLVAS